MYIYGIYLWYSLANMLNSWGLAFALYADFHSIFDDAGDAISTDVCAHIYLCIYMIYVLPISRRLQSLLRYVIEICWFFWGKEHREFPIMKCIAEQKITLKKNVNYKCSEHIQNKWKCFIKTKGNSLDPKQHKYYVFIPNIYIHFILALEAFKCLGKQLLRPLEIFP